MKYSHEQRINMASMGIDPDQLENPKQALPPVDQRVRKLERYIKQNHPRSNEYREKLKVYKVLNDPTSDTNTNKRSIRKLWKSIFGG